MSGEDRSRSLPTINSVRQVPRMVRRALSDGQSLAEWMANSRNRQVEFEADIAASAEVSSNIFIEKLVWLWFK